MVRDVLDQVHSLRLKTLQEMGFIREVDRAMARSIMAEFLRLQLIIRDDLNTSLRALHADLEATTGHCSSEFYKSPIQEPCNKCGPMQVKGATETEAGTPISSIGCST